ncbi:hypothetical protein VUR80DRAFT_1491 [Thermomyces stellatus]
MADPETRSKLVALQKEDGNNNCCDCNAASPQWASPKFGIFICLECAGSHRALGVHISFVRSVTMDAFKPAELERMRLGGNNRWKKFWSEHANSEERAIPWEKDTIPRRYPGFLGEQYKDSLSCEVEGKPFTLGERKQEEKSTPKSSASPEASRSGTPLSGRRDTQPGQGGRVKVDDKYFAKLGADNAARRDDVPPSQGGKYGGFGNTPAPAPGAGQGDGGLPFDEWQRDSMAAITKGFGWFASTVTKTAKTVNEGYIQPTASKLAESDFGRQAQLTAAAVARQAQEGARNANENFMRFVEGESSGRRAAPMDESRREFWDEFASIGERRAAASGGGTSTLGTAAMGKGRKKDDDWDW